MPEHYSPKHFRQPVPCKLQREFFARRVEHIELACDAPDLTHIDQIYHAGGFLPGASRADVEPPVRALGGGRSSQSGPSLNFWLSTGSRG